MEYHGILLSCTEYTYTKIIYYLCKFKYNWVSYIIIFWSCQLHSFFMSLYPIVSVRVAMSEQIRSSLSDEWLSGGHLIQAKSIRLLSWEMELGARTHRWVWMLSWMENTSMIKELVMATFHHSDRATERRMKRCWGMERRLAGFSTLCQFLLLALSEAWLFNKLLNSLRYPRILIHILFT